MAAFYNWDRLYGLLILRQPVFWKKSEPEISRVLFSLMWAVIIHLGLPLPTTSSVLPNRQAGSLIAVLFGLATGGVYTASPVTRTAVGFYPAISPLPVFPEKPSAVCFLLHYPLARTIWLLASTLPYVARTFLQYPGIKTKPGSQRSRIRLWWILNYQHCR